MTGSTPEPDVDARSTAWHESWIGRILVAQFGVLSLLAIGLIVIGPDTLSTIVRALLVETLDFSDYSALHVEVGA